MRNVIIIAVAATLLTTASLPLHAWSNHFLFYRPAIEVMPEIAAAPKVRVEAFDEFLLKEKDGLVALLTQVENEARTTYAKSAPQPAELAFKGGDAATIRVNFLKAIRINPGTPLGYFIQQLPDKPLIRARANANLVTLFGEKELVGRYEMYAIDKGDMVAPLDVLATAGDEPDFGLDINLFTDNNADFSKNYGFGTQSFGDPKLYYGSQAPFHIGYYHESSIIFFAGSFLKRTYPRYRVHQFMNLARYAFATGHPYWGYRFLGWGLHYVGDLTQPYHSRVLPTYSTMAMLWINIKAILGFEQAKTDAVNRISARHTTIEDYHFSVLRNAYIEKKFDHPFIRSVMTTARDKDYGTFNDTFLVDVIAKTSYDISDRLDILIDQSNLLKGFVKGKLTGEINPPALAELDKLIVSHMQNVGPQLRSYVRAGLLK